MARPRRVLGDVRREYEIVFLNLEDYVVREGEHDGDSFELHHAGDVPAVRRRPVRDEPL